MTNPRAGFGEVQWTRIDRLHGPKTEDIESHSRIAGWGADTRLGLRHSRDVEDSSATPL
jgi:hypothetical protein